MARPKGLSDDEWRARMREQWQRRRADPEKWKRRLERAAERNRERRESDPEFRARQCAYAQKHRDANRDHVNALARKYHQASLATPEGKERNAAQCRKYRNGPTRDAVLAKQRENHQRNRDENNAKRNARYYETREEQRPVRAEKLRQARKDNPPNLLFHSAKWRAKKKGLPFDLTLGYLRAEWTGRCAVTDLPFVTGETSGPKFFSPSLDRIDPKLGYVIGNVRFVLWAVNALKHDATDADMYAVAEAIIKNRKP